MSAPRLFVPEPVIADDCVSLPASEAHHATRVLRLRDGDDVRVFDGRGREWSGRLRISPSPAAVDVRTVPAVAEPPVHVTLAIALLKGDQIDHAVRDATMLGVAAIQPIVSDHVTVPARAWESGAAVERWRRVAIASAKQCGRAVVPEIRPVSDLAGIFVDPAEKKVRLLFAEPATGAGTLSVSQSIGDRPAAATIFVGPEGGWSAEEVERAAAAGVRLIGLGPRTLRAESVPAVALAALWTVWGW